MGIELLWRGWSHGSMFLAGGASFLLLGKLNETAPRLPFPAKAVAAAGIITLVEYTAGLLFNRDYRVWDYRELPLNYQGQICLSYGLLWMPLGLAAMGIYRVLDNSLQKKLG